MILTIPLHEIKARLLAGITSFTCVSDGVGFIRERKWNPFSILFFAIMEKSFIAIWFYCPT